MSEGLAVQLKPLGMGVTVLCPGFVRTRISGSARNRPERYGPARAPDPASPAGRLAAESARLQAPGLAPADIAAQALMAIPEADLYAVPPPETHDGATDPSSPIRTPM